MLQVIKCHTCGRNATYIGGGDCGCEQWYKEYRCGKGHISRLYDDEEGRAILTCRVIND